MHTSPIIALLLLVLAGGGIALFCTVRAYCRAILRGVNSLSVVEDVDRELAELEERVAALAAQAASDIDTLRAALMAEQEARKEVCETLAKAQQAQNDLIKRIGAKNSTKISAKHQDISGLPANEIIVATLKRRTANSTKSRSKKGQTNRVGTRKVA